ncbi:MAG: hypothetical protein ACLSFT_02845 [Ruminococcus callidus]
MVHGAEAAKRAIAAAGIDPLEIGLLIDTTITPEYCTPSMSCIIQGNRCSQCGML